MANPKQVASGGLFVQLPSLFYFFKFFKINIKTVGKGRNLEFRAVAGLNLLQLRMLASCLGQTGRLWARQKV
jgi:hypothetical protein